MLDFLGTTRQFPRGNAPCYTAFSPYKHKLEATQHSTSQSTTNNGGNMKRYHILSVILSAAAIVFFTRPGQGEEKKANYHWYKLNIQTGSSTFQCTGGSPLDEKEFVKQLAGTEYIALEDLVYMDQTGKVKSWQEWDARVQPRAYVNPKYVIFVNPMAGDPRETPTGAAPSTK
jgi:hypothetical protein